MKIRFCDDCRYSVAVDYFGGEAEVMYCAHDAGNVKTIYVTGLAETCEHFKRSGGNDD